MRYKAVFTGGGTAGHVTPNLALMRKLREEGFEIEYIGTAGGIEHTLLQAAEPDIPYHAISAGKLRRYFSLENVADMFRTLKGIRQAGKLVKKIQPDVVFSKGGFVAVPVVIGARNKAPIVIHESDYTPGLANRIASRFANTVCVTFEDTLRYVPQKGVFTGTPIRSQLFCGDAARGREMTGFNTQKPVLLMMGGSQGAQAVNDGLRAALPRLLSTFQVVHLCGKGKLEEAAARPGYVQYEYVNEQLPDILAMADIVLSRAGANAAFEFLALQKPALFVPLPRSASRGDQIVNAAYFAKKGYAAVLEQENMTPDTLAYALESLYRERERYIAAMRQEQNADGTEAVLREIRRAAQSKV